MPHLSCNVLLNVTTILLHTLLFVRKRYIFVLHLFVVTYRLNEMCTVVYVHVLLVIKFAVKRMRRKQLMIYIFYFCVHVYSSKHENHKIVFLKQIYFNFVCTSSLSRHIWKSSNFCQTVMNICYYQHLSRIFIVHYLIQMLLAINGRY